MSPISRNILKLVKFRKLDCRSPVLSKQFYFDERGTYFVYLFG